MSNTKTPTAKAPTTEIAKANPNPAPATAVDRAKAVIAKVSAADYYDQAAAPDQGTPEPKFAAIPYIGFRGQKTTAKVEELDAKGVKVDDFYLYDNEVIPVKPMNVHVIKHATFYTAQDDDMNVTGVRFDPEPEREGYKSPYREHLIAVVAVRIPTATGAGVAFKAARIQLRSAHCKALQRAIDMLATARDPEAWAARSKAHAASVGAKVAGGRFYTTIWSTREKPKSGKGQPYNLGHGAPKMPTAEETLAFNEWFDKARGGELGLVAAQFENGCDWLRKVARGEIDPTADRG